MSTSEEEAASEPVATSRIRGVATVFVGLSYSYFRLRYFGLSYSNFGLQYLERPIDYSIGKIIPVLCIQTYNHVQKYFPGCLSMKNLALR